MRAAFSPARSKRGKFECSFAEGTRPDHVEFRKHMMGSILPALAERLPLTVVFEQRSGFSRMSANALIEHMNGGLDWSAYDLVMMRSFYPCIEVRVEPKTEPGLQVTDLLLWSALQQLVEPASHKARVIDWCGAFRWAHGGIEGDSHKDAKYLLNLRSPELTERTADRVGYPVQVDDLDEADTSTLMNAYCLAERTVREAAKGPLPAHAEHLRRNLVRTVSMLQHADRVGPDQIGEVARQYIRLFDTVPLYEGLGAKDERWLLFVRTKRLLALTLRQDLLHGGATADFFANARRRLVRSEPHAFGILS